MSASASATAGSIGLSGLLAILFVALKLTGVIAWSWWWVLAPVWIPAVILALILAWIVGLRV